MSVVLCWSSKLKGDWVEAFQRKTSSKAFQSLRCIRSDSMVLQEGRNGVLKVSSFKAAWDSNPLEYLLSLEPLDNFSSLECQYHHCIERAN